jgi:hypothetical protein
MIDDLGRVRRGDRILAACGCVMPFGSADSRTALLWNFRNVSSRAASTHRAIDFAEFAVRSSVAAGRSPENRRNASREEEAVRQ